MSLLKTAVLLLVLCSAPLFAQDKVQDTPNPIERPQSRNAIPGQLPFWIPADYLLDESGRPSELLRSSAQTLLMDVMQQSRGDCFPSRHPFPAFNVEGRQTLKSVAKHADWIFTARVIRREAGFQQVFPGLMLEVAPLKVFKGPEDRLDSQYVFFPGGEVHFGDWKICHSDARYPEVPDLGDELILLVRLSATNKESRFLEGDDSMFVTLLSNGLVSLPSRYADDAEVQNLRQPAELLFYLEQV